MSRCYPFPPPGYEKKARTEDIDFLKKEKNREKKHKKEKRDREKKEGEAKREEDRSDYKQKEKKEKCRDARKDKEKIRDKDKNNYVTLDEMKFSGHAEAGKGEKNNEKSKEREKAKITVLGEKVIGNSTVYNGVVIGKNNHLFSEKKNIEHFHELCNKIGTEKGNKGNLFAEKYPITEKNKDMVMPRIGVTTPATPMATSERSKERKVNDRRIDGHGPGERPLDKVHAQKVVGVAPNRVGVIRQVEKNAGRRIEVKEKIKGVERNGKKGEKRKDEDREKTIDKYKEEVKKIKVERPKDMGGELLVEQLKLKDSSKVHTDPLRGKDGNDKDSVVAQSVRPTKLVKEDSKVAATAAPENLRKRKDFGCNAVLSDSDVGPIKVPRIMSSSLPMTENGRSFHNSTTLFAPVEQQALSNAKEDEADVGPNSKARTTSSLLVTKNGRSLLPSQDSSITTPVKQQALSKVKQNYKVHRTYGTDNSTQSSSRTSQSTELADWNSRAVKKLLPHPDTKYLTQVLSVPQMEEWSAFDEHEWLFRSSHSQLNKPKEEIARVDEIIQQVWAEAVRIESADVYALPYVIPR
ncbi:hypothetical protein V2J09_017747 [Rumex salicifolius]